MKDKRLKRGMILVAFAALLYFLITNFYVAISFIGNVFSVLTPFIYGLLIAYILKFPYNFFASLVGIEMSFALFSNVLVLTVNFAFK